MRLILVILLFSLQASATTYYVRTDGSNANTGTTNSSGGAWLTHIYAMAHVSSGDLIITQAGTYVENGTVNVPVGVSWEGVDSATCIIKDTVTTEFTPMVLLASGAEGTAGNQHIAYLNFQGQSLATQVGISVYARSSVLVYNCSFRDFKFANCIFTGSTSLFPNNVEPTTYATGNKYYNNRSFNCSGFGAWAGSYYGSAHIWTIGQEGIEVYSNVMNQTERATRANGWLIKATDYTKGMKIYNNTITKARYTYANPGDYNGTDQYWDFAIEMGDEQGLEIYGNSIQGSIDMNRQVKGIYAYSAYIHDNVIGFPSLGSGYENGLIFEYSTDVALVQDNTFTNIANIVEFSTRSANVVNNFLMTNNLAYNMGAANGNHSGGAVHFISDGSNNYVADSIFIYNNTFECNSTYTPYYGISLSNAAAATNVRITNNTLGYFDQFAIGANNGAVLDQLEIVTNNLHNNGGSNAPVWISGTPTNYTYSGTITGDPLYTNTSINDYSLQVTSPDYGTATNVGYGTNIGYWQTSTPAPTSGFKIRGRRVRFIR